ncbi:unnamed protein product, partial [Discosporangium mesarthrocarpum]
MTAKKNKVLDPMTVILFGFWVHFGCEKSTTRFCLIYHSLEDTKKLGPKFHSCATACKTRRRPPASRSRRPRTG